MKIKELFTVGDMIQSIGGLAVFLNRDNCQIKNWKKTDEAVVLTLKRQSDGEEGHAYLRARKEFSEIGDQLLGWVFSSGKVRDLTLNQLSELETDLQVTSIGGRMMLNR
jgi:hypothetical protein